MPLIDYTEIEDSFNPKLNSPTNVNSNNSALGVDLDNVGNEYEYEDESVNDSFNTTDSFNDYIKTDVDVDVAVDNSTNVGNREYNTGGNDLDFEGAGGKWGGAGSGGPVFIDDRDTVVDQSINGIVSTFGFGPVAIGSSAEALTVSGDGNTVAGDDLTVTYNVDNSTNIFGVNNNLGDGTQTVETNINSGNSFSYEDNDDYNTVIIDDSFNHVHPDVDIDDSFNYEPTAVFAPSLEVEDINAIVNSIGAGIIDVDVD